MANQPAHRPVRYQPFVAADEDGLFAAAEVNRLLLEAEQGFETYIRALEAENAPNKALIETQVAELQTLTELVAEDRAKMAELHDRLKDQAEHIDHLNAQRVAREEAHSQLENTLAVMKNSTSWRLTKPLRRLTAMLRGK